MIDEDEAFRRQFAAEVMRELVSSGSAGSIEGVPQYMKYFADFAVIAADALMERLGIKP